MRYEQLPCGPGDHDRVPAIVFEESTQWSDDDRPTRATYWFGPGVARLQYDDAEVILDAQQQLVARLDTSSHEWQVQHVDEWQAYVDSATAATNLRLSPHFPKFVDRKSRDRLAGYWSSRYTLSARKTSDERTRLLIENDVWVTKDIDVAEDMYAVYRLALRLFDGRIIDLPAKRPDGIILRSRLSWHPIRNPSRDDDLVEDSVIESVRYELAPRSFFEIPYLPSDDERAIGGPIPAPKPAHRAPAAGRRR